VSKLACLLGYGLFLRLAELYKALHLLSPELKRAGCTRTSDFPFGRETFLWNGASCAGTSERRCKTLTPDLADAMKLKGQPTGALVGELESNAPAARAGIKTGDLIAGVNGKKIMTHANCV
jgi:S1-C subfamily serine protease